TGGVSVQPDGDITGVTLNPVQPSPGQAFTVSGTCSALGLTMGAQVLLPGGAGSSASSPILLGAFSIGLTAPVGLDNTRSIGGLLMESGSWGIQLTRTGGLTPPYPKKVVTVRTGAPAPTAARVWDIFE
ncbi:hypothetical protein HY256_08040, partial [Candidatus Sumerlaeota bacterium]|nr:hypothetical protein [Candidatus Sumerlaeota bacterium]